MKDAETNDTAYKFEIVEMFGVNARVRVDLKGVVVVS